MSDVSTTPAPPPSSPARAGEPAAALQLVPPVTGVLFWTTKILTTGAGEVTSDYMARSSLAIFEVGVAGLLFLVAMTAQLRARSYSPTRYWSAALMISVFGTAGADIVHVVFGVPYVASTSMLGVILAGLLWTWRRSEGTLSIHSITTPRRQWFYWATVMCTFALGTAAGDMFATSLGLGYLVSGVVFTALILLPLVGWRLGVNGVAAFWTAYILTRPLGASFSDWAAVDHARGGLDFGPGPVALVLLAAIAVALVLIEAGRRRGPALV